MNTKAAALITLMEVLAASDPVRNDLMGPYNPSPNLAAAAPNREDRKTKRRRRMAARSRKINRKGK
jgi:hypothetical protein